MVERDYVKAKETLVVFAILYFVGALLTAIALIFLIVAGAGIGMILGYLFALLWRIGTGVVLIVKQRRAVPISVGPIPAGTIPVGSAGL